MEELVVCSQVFGVRSVTHGFGEDSVTAVNGASKKWFSEQGYRWVKACILKD